MASFAVAIMEHLPRLKRYALWLRRDHGEAEDLVQETVAHALENARLYRHDSNLCGWLVTIMHNLHVNALRLHRRDPAFVCFDAVPAPGCPATQEAPVELREIRRAVARLPRNQREALLLHWLFGLGYHEVAARLGIPRGTVLSRISRARVALRAIIAEPGSGLGLAHRDGRREQTGRLAARAVAAERHDIAATPRGCRQQGLPDGFVERVKRERLLEQGVGSAGFVDGGGVGVAGYQEGS